MASWAFGIIGDVQYADAMQVTRLLGGCEAGLGGIQSAIRAVASELDTDTQMKALYERTLACTHLYHVLPLKVTCYLQVSYIVVNKGSPSVGVLQHILAEFVSERVRLELLRERFHAVHYGRGQHRHAQSAEVHLLQSSIMHYEALLKELKTQLVAEHQARAVATQKYQILKNSTNRQSVAKSKT